MCDKYNKYNASKTRRCSNDCTNNINNNSKNIATNSCTWMFNLLAVALLIQHVACVAQASEHVSLAATTTTATAVLTTKSPISPPFTPVVLLVKRHVDNGNSSSSNKKVQATHTDVEFGSRATSRRLSAIDAVGGSVASGNAGGDGLNFAAYVNGEFYTKV
ncbi:uncharacterized protein LOC128858233 [Anastrepha ludens]|uniref:uncharacterized protein LOC128858233 n=1 Tax=Anastrepha ludens TaxID=28586 RepID=UPI0023B0EF46|nr:uncharacterized protein LOC128858233 [Anastrepha ludens]XP_053950299.1 uncharacterized protein LOC128858233 [Anastrepha ludens]